MEHAEKRPVGGRMQVSRESRLRLFRYLSRRIWQVRYPTGILCHRYRLIYFPVPKSACTTVKRIIGRLEGLPADGNPHHDIPFAYVRGNELERFPDYARFTVTRDPWDRLVSCYKDKIQGRPRAGRMDYADGVSPSFERYNRLLFTKVFRPDMSFAAFVRMIGRIPDALADGHFRSQHRLFCRPDGTPLANTVIGFDDLHDGLPAFLATRGAAIEPLERRPEPDYGAYYTEELRAIVAARYRRDFELLNCPDRPA